MECLDYTSQRRGRSSIALKDPMIGEEREFFTRNLIQDHIQLMNPLTDLSINDNSQKDEPDFSQEPTNSMSHSRLVKSASQSGLID